MTEIRYAYEPIPVSSPVRTLMRDGQWIERPADYQRYEGERNWTPPPSRKRMRGWKGSSLSR